MHSEQCLAFGRDRQQWASRIERLALAFCAVLLVATARAGESDLAVVSFSLDFPASDPEHYSISVDSNGHAKYECNVHPPNDSEEQETYQTEFDVTPASRSRIFDLAAQAHFFAKKVDSGNSKLASTGAKKLIYQKGGETHSAEYNYSQVIAVQQLTSIFQNIALTMEYGRRLLYYHRFQKLALDDELKRMETQAKDNELAELQAVQPILKELYDDPSVMNVVRARAERLMDMAKSGTVRR